jgi:O-antigen/teichoic acid export membrane protein
VASKSVKASVVLLAGSFVSNLLLLVNVLIVARLLGHTGYGNYSLGISPATVFVLFSGIGVNTAITRFSAYHISRGELDEAKSKTLNGIRFLLLLGAGLTVACYLSAPFFAYSIYHNPSLEPFIRLASLAVLGQIAFQVGLASLVGWSWPKQAGLSYIVQGVVKAAMAPALILVGLGIFGAVLAQVSSLLVAASVAIIALYLAKIRGPGKKQGFRLFLADVKELIRFGLPSELGGYFSNFAGQNYITIVLGAFAAASVGYFQAATSVTAIISIISTSLALSLFAGFSSLHGQKRDTGLGFVYAVKYTAYISSPFIFFLIAASKPIIRIIFGVAYLPAAPLLALISFSNIPMVIGQSVFVPFFNGIGKTRFTMFAFVADGVASLVLAPPLAKFGGAVGVTFALLGSNLASGVVALFLAKNYLGTEIDYKSSSLAVGASLVCAAAVYVLGLLNPSSSLLPTLLMLILQFVVFFGLYLLVAPLVRVVKKDDIARLMAASKGMNFFSSFAIRLLKIEEKLSHASGKALTKETAENC